MLVLLFLLICQLSLLIPLLLIQCSIKAHKPSKEKVLLESNQDKTRTTKNDVREGEKATDETSQPGNSSREHNVSKSAEDNEKKEVPVENKKGENEEKKEVPVENKKEENEDEKKEVSVENKKEEDKEEKKEESKKETANEGGYNNAEKMEEVNKVGEQVLQAPKIEKNVELTQIESMTSKKSAKKKEEGDKNSNKLEVSSTQYSRKEYSKKKGIKKEASREDMSEKERDIKEGGIQKDSKESIKYEKNMKGNEVATNMAEKQEKNWSNKDKGANNGSKKVSKEEVEKSKGKSDGKLDGPVKQKDDNVENDSRNESDNNDEKDVRKDDGKYKIVLSPTADSLSVTETTKSPPQSTKDILFQPKEVNWTTTGGQQSITITNTTNRRQALKVKCSDNKIYKFSPVFSFIETGQTINIDLRRRPGNPKIDKIVLVQAPAQSTDRDAMKIFKKPGCTPHMFTIPLTVST